MEIHPWKFTWNIRIIQLKRKIILHSLHFLGFHFWYICSNEIATSHDRWDPPKGSVLEGKWDPGYFRKIHVGEILFHLPRPIDAHGMNITILKIHHHFVGIVLSFSPTTFTSKSKNPSKISPIFTILFPQSPNSYDSQYRLLFTIRNSRVFVSHFLVGLLVTFSSNHENLRVPPQCHPPKK